MQRESEEEVLRELFQGEVPWESEEEGVLQEFQEGVQQEFEEEVHLACQEVEAEDWVEASSKVEAAHQAKVETVVGWTLGVAHQAGRWEEKTLAGVRVELWEVPAEAAPCSEVQPEGASELEEFQEMEELLLGESQVQLAV